MGFFAWLRTLFSGQVSQDGYRVAKVYRSLRQQALAATTGHVEVPGDQSTICVLMETGYPGAVASVVAMADGTASLYVSNGGGVLGAGAHAGPNAAARKFVAAAQAFAVHCSPTQATPLPALGMTRFYLVTRQGLWTYEAKDSDLGNHRLPMSALFHIGHELIAQMRLVSGKN